MNYQNFLVLFSYRVIPTNSNGLRFMRMAKDIHICQKFCFWFNKRAKGCLKAKSLKVNIFWMDRFSSKNMIWMDTSRPHLSKTVINWFARSFAHSGMAQTFKNYGQKWPKDKILKSNRKRQLFNYLIIP